MPGMLGKRRRKSYGSRRMGGRAPKRPRTSRRSGNLRTGGLYRLRGTKPRGRRVAEAELKFYDRQIHTTNPADAQTDDTNVLALWRTNAGANAQNGAILAAGTWYKLPSLVENINQGAQSYERIGRKIIIKSILIDLLLGFNSGAQGQPTSWKFYLMLDKQCNGTSPSVTDIFSQPAGAAGTPTAPSNQDPVTTELPSIANRQRFQILKEKTFTITPQLAQQIMLKPVKHYMRCNIPIEYGGTPGALNTIKSNNIFCLMTSTYNNATTQTLNWGCDGMIRLRYSDL